MQQKRLYQGIIALLMVVNLGQLGFILKEHNQKKVTHQAMMEGADLSPITQPPPPPHLANQPAQANKDMDNGNDRSMNGKPPNNQRLNRDAQQHSFSLTAVQILGLDEQQQQEFANLSMAHRETMLTLQQQQKELTLAYFDNPDDTTVLKQLTDIEAQKITTTEQHFKEVYALLTPAQQPDFANFKAQALAMIIR